MCESDGNVLDGGDCSPIQDQLVDVRYIYTTSGAFAALKQDGTVVTWGLSVEWRWDDEEDEKYQVVVDGGDCSNVKEQLVDVQYIYSTKFAFAALKADGSIVAWGLDVKKARDKANAAKKHMVAPRQVGA